MRHGKDERLLLDDGSMSERGMKIDGFVPCGGRANGFRNILVGEKSPEELRAGFSSKTSP